MTHIVHWKFVKRRGALFLEQRGEKQCFALSTYQAISMASLIISFFISPCLFHLIGKDRF